MNEKSLEEIYSVQNKIESVKRLIKSIDDVCSHFYDNDYFWGAFNHLRDNTIALYQEVLCQQPKI